MTATIEEKKASLAVITGAYKLFLTKLPLPIRYKRKVYKSYVDSLSDTAFRYYGSTIVLVLPLTKKESIKFKNLHEELNNVLNDIPRLKYYQGVLSGCIKKHRRKYKLKT